MIEWTDEAIEAAIDALPSRRLDADEINAILDAAVKAQGEQSLGVITVSRYNATYNEGYVDGRAEALEEAARIAQLSVSAGDDPAVIATAHEIADDIRALKGETP